MDRYGDVLPQSILKPRAAGEGNPLYVALSFADEPDLVALQGQLRQLGYEGEWQDPGLLHCSLVYIKDANDEQVASLTDGISLPVRFSVEVASLGTMDQEEVPLVANVAASPALIRVQQEFTAAAVRMRLPLGEYFAATMWKPHITLAYDSDAEMETLPPLDAIINLPATAVLLMRDDYQVVRRILLPEAAPDRAFVEAGGRGSGYFAPEHKGRPGEVGGSLPSGEVSEEARPTAPQSGRAIERRLLRRYGEATPRNGTWIGPSGRFLAPDADHQESAIWVLGWGNPTDPTEGQPMSDDYVRKGFRATNELILSGIIRYNDIEGVVAFDVPSFSSVTPEQRSAMALLLETIAGEEGAWPETVIVAEGAPFTGRDMRDRPYESGRDKEGDEAYSFVGLDWPFATPEGWRYVRPVERHYGPGPHPGTGTEQVVHAGEVGGSLPPDRADGLGRVMSGEQLYRYQDKRVEALPKQLQHRIYGSDLEAAGDVFREVTLHADSRISPYGSRSYVGEKLARIERDIEHYYWEALPLLPSHHPDAALAAQVGAEFEALGPLPDPVMESARQLNLAVARRDGRDIREAVARVRSHLDMTALTSRHYGPGSHPGTGTDQAVHAGGGAADEVKPAENEPYQEEIMAGARALLALPDDLQVTARNLARVLAQERGIADWRRCVEQACAITESQSHDAFQFKGGIAGMAEAFEIRDARGARVTGYLRDADFPGEYGSATRGEIFYVEVPEAERGRGLGSRLVVAGLRQIVNVGGQTVNMAGVTQEGRWLIDSLVRQGAITPIRMSGTGKGEYRIAVPAESAVEQSVAGPLRRVVLKHYGPGPHPGTGTAQEVHAGTSISEAARPKSRRWPKTLDGFPLGCAVLRHPELAVPGEPIVKAGFWGVELADTPSAQGRVRLETMESIEGHRLYVVYAPGYTVKPEPEEDEEEDLSWTAEPRAEPARWYGLLEMRHLVPAAPGGIFLQPLIHEERVGKDRRESLERFLRGARREARRDIREWNALTERHYGPGPHPGTGTEQQVHAGGRVSEEARVSGTGAGRAGAGRGRYNPTIQPDGLGASVVMVRTERWKPVWNAVEAIDQVHRMPDYLDALLLRSDGVVPITTTPGDIRAGGYWQWTNDGCKKIGIDLRAAQNMADWESPHIQLTTAHEVGHMIDNVLFGDPTTGFHATDDTDHASIGTLPGMRTSLSAEMGAVMYAIGHSESYTRLAEEDLSDFAVEGVPSRFGYTPRAAVNIVSGGEAFARSYAQWVTLRSGNAEMRAQVDARNSATRRGAPHAQWEWDDFQPIAEAYDHLFEAAGLLRSRP